jgi:acetyl esterase/lipase
MLEAIIVKIENTELRQARSTYHNLTIFLFMFVASIMQPTFAESDCPPPGLISDIGIAVLEKAPRGEKFSYGDDPLQFGELYLPPGDGPFPVVVMIHGGCWLAQFDQAHMRSLAVAIRDQGYAVWNLEYRRVGNAGGGWPGTFLDVAAGTDYLRELARKRPLDLNRVVPVGHSAGGHLALWLAARSKLALQSDIYTENPLPLKAVLAMAPGVDIRFVSKTQICGDVINRLMGGTPTQVPERYNDAAPISHIPLGIPHTILTGDFDGYELLGRSYFYSATAAGDKQLQHVTAPESGHFEMIDPKTSSWPIVLEALQGLF